ncbi:hypothetical protein [Rugosimonospora africana]|uniref:Peptidase inhibitor family I36 n=1 Tax=Rugosimonospora africana TaxID=556532 RepID=A0A8J3QWA7_9ACTN|nr:hypothetical protein [Rugosimonospora africana]GIH17716.1 hypothetical protein Raf01_58880 [Rugosimonospora africana]
MRLHTLAAATVVAAGLALAAVPAQAQAAPAAPRHCVADVSTHAAPVCYGSFTTAIAKATGGRIADAPGDARAAVKNPAFEARLNALSARTGAVAPAASIVIGIEYADDDYEGSSLIYSAPAGCTTTLNDVDYWVDVLPSGWNDEIESFRTYANCDAMHYLDIYRQGSSLGWWASWGDLYFLNDEVSSIAWS